MTVREREHRKSDWLDIFQQPILAGFLRFFCEDLFRRLKRSLIFSEWERDYFRQ